MSSPPDRPACRPPPDRPPSGAALAVEDFRSLRRWVVALGLLSLAALAVAVIALLRAEEREREPARDPDARVLVRELDDRVERLDERVRRSSEESDTSRLDRRLRRVEENLTEAVDGAADASTGVVRLQRRIDDLARDVQALRRR